MKNNDILNELSEILKPNIAGIDFNDNSSNLLDLRDKNGIKLPQNSIIFGWLPSETENERYFYRIDFSNTFGTNEPKNEITMFCREKGYKHNVKQSDIVNFSYVGKAEKLLHLLNI